MNPARHYTIYTGLKVLADIRLAGIDEDLQKRVKMASELLQAHQVNARLDEWDGTRCHCVVINENDAYGDHVREVARRLKLPVLTLSKTGKDFDPSTYTIGHYAPLNLYARALYALVSQKLGAKTETSEAKNREITGLEILAEEYGETETDLKAVVNGNEIFLLKSSDRVAARKKTDILEAQQQLCSSGWALMTTSPPDLGNYCVESLETFLVRGAIQNASKLPAFRDGFYRLRYWPDLGSATDLVVALRISNLLQRQATTPAGISRQFNIDSSQTSAILWAFKAASILRSDQTAEHESAKIQSELAKPAENVFKKLAQKFGLAT